MFETGYWQVIPPQLPAGKRRRPGRFVRLADALADLAAEDPLGDREGTVLVCAGDPARFRWVDSPDTQPGYYPTQSSSNSYQQREPSGES